jgi:hypothetical protein
MADNLGNINKAYVSAIDPVLDTREINKLVTDIQNDDALTDILWLGDRKKPISTGQPIYYTFVNEALFKLLDTTGGTVNGSGTTSINFTCTTATSGQARKDDLVLVPTGAISAIVTNVVTTSGVDTVYIKSVSGANMTLTAGNKLSLFSVAVGENSVSQTNLRFGLTKYTNKYQIFREISKITDVQNAATIEVEFNGQNKFIVKDHLEKAILLKGKINAAFIAGDMSVTTFSDTNPILTDGNTSGSDGGGPVQTTRGLNKYIEMYGNTIVNGTLGTVQKANIDDALDTLIAAKSPKDYLVFGSSAVKRAHDTYWKALGSSGVQSVRIVVDGKELDLQVDKVSYGGFTLNYMAMPIQDQPVLFGQTVINKCAYYVPYNNRVKVQGGGYDSAMRVRYVPAQTKFGNDMIGEIHSGAISPVNPNGDAMNWTCSWTTAQGLECLGVQHFLRQQVLS